MTAKQLLMEITADLWVGKIVWQYFLEQRVGVVATAYAAAVIKEGGHPPNGAEADKELQETGIDGGHSSEWWAVQLLREIGYWACVRHPEGVKALADKYYDFEVRWTRLSMEMDAWLTIHMATRPAVEAGTYRFGLDPAYSRPPEWFERKAAGFWEVAAWVDGGGLDRFRAVARQWALRADKGLDGSGGDPSWMGSVAFREEVGVDFTPLLLPPDWAESPWDPWEPRKAARRASSDAADALWQQWQDAVDAAFPDVPRHNLTAYRGGVGPH